MAFDRNAAVVKELRTLFNVGVVRELTDGQLLERFATDCGEAAELAFAVLVERHGPMVLRVCRGILADSHDTEDAFQATFLVLVQKARGLWVRDSLGPWLHQVACRTASRARLAAARRWRHEGRAAAARAESHTVNTDDLEGLLHEEIENLPERYRAPLVLCDLEGRSHEQAARHLGWPLGTVKSRQARGRERLRDRLRRRGLAPNVGLLGSGIVLSGPDPVVSPALIESTTRSVVQFVTCQTAVRASTLSLAQGVLKAMSFTRWSKVASVLLVVGATVSGAGIFAQRQGPAAPIHAGNKAPKIFSLPDISKMQVNTMVHDPHINKVNDDLITFPTRPETLAVTVEERGYLESARNDDVFSAIEGTTSIMSIVPEGTSVKRGQLLYELDSASLKDQLVQTRIAAQNAEIAYQNTKFDREVAEIAVKEFTEVTFNHELNAVKGEVAAAQSAIQKSESRLDRTRRARQRLGEVMASKKGIVAPSDILAELELEDRVDAVEQTLSREKAAVLLAKSKLEVLEKYTKDKTIKTLAADLERKRSDELAKGATWELIKGKVRAIERQIAACKIRAPADGFVAYANPPRRSATGPPSQRIEEGAAVRERQKILSVFAADGPKQVNTKVHEAKVDKISPGMKAKIRVDAFPNQLFDGTVVDVAPLPDVKLPNQVDSTKVYTTHVMIDNSVLGLRPGMNAHVEFLVAQRDNVLSVPVQAVVRFEGKWHVVVRTPGGGIDWRDVKLGISSDTRVEITEGIQSGDTVVVNPTALVSDQQTHENGGTSPEANRER